MDWKIAPKIASYADGDAAADIPANQASQQHEDEERTITADQADITAVADTVGKLQVQVTCEEGNKTAPLTDHDVTAAVVKVKAKSTLFAHCQSGPKGRSTIKNIQKPYMAVPPIKDCLVKESSLLKEIKAEEAQRLANAFSKTQQMILGKRAEANRDDAATEEGNTQQDEDTSTSHKRSKHGEQVEPTDGGREEATSPGAAGQLTGADERACQKP